MNFYSYRQSYLLFQRICIFLSSVSNFHFFSICYLRRAFQADDDLTSLDPRALLDMAKNASEQLCPVHYVAVSLHPTAYTTSLMVTGGILQIDRTGTSFNPFVYVS